MSVNRWMIYDWMKYRYMKTGVKPTRDEVLNQFQGADFEEIAEGIAEFNQSTRRNLGKEAERMRSRSEQVERFEIWYQGEKIGEAEDLLKTEKLIEELEAKLKIHADQMVVKTIYREGDEERG